MITLRQAVLFVALMLVTGFVAASVLRSNGILIHEIYWLQESLGGDLVIHGLMGAALMCVVHLSVGQWPAYRASVGLLIVAALVAIEECSQLFIATRAFHLPDLVAGQVGALVMFTVMNSIDYLQGRPADSP